jgi:hypothetical protein
LLQWRLHLPRRLRHLRLPILCERRPDLQLRCRAVLLVASRERRAPLPTRLRAPLNEDAIEHLDFGPRDLLRGAGLSQRGSLAHDI